MQLTQIVLGSNPKPDVQSPASVGVPVEIGTENQSFARILNDKVRTVSVSYDQTADLGLEPQLASNQMAELPQPAPGNGLPQRVAELGLAGKNLPQLDAEPAFVSTRPQSLNAAQDLAIKSLPQGSMDGVSVNALHPNMDAELGVAAKISVSQSIANADRMAIDSVVPEAPEPLQVLPSLAQPAPVTSGGALPDVSSQRLHAMPLQTEELVGNIGLQRPDIKAELRPNSAPAPIAEPVSLAAPVAEPIAISAAAPSAQAVPVEPAPDQPAAQPSFQAPIQAPVEPPVNAEAQSTAKPSVPVMPVFPGLAPKLNGTPPHVGDEGGAPADPAKPAPLTVPISRLPDKVVQVEPARIGSHREFASGQSALVEERMAQGEAMALARREIDNLAQTARPTIPSSPVSNPAQALQPALQPQSQAQLQAQSQSSTESGASLTAPNLESASLAQTRATSASGTATQPTQPIASPAAQAPISAPNPVGEAAPPAPVIRDTAPLERLVETVSQMRESGQMGRGEIALRHSEFGTISMRVAVGDGDIQARLSSRDPSFAVAAQAAMVERASAERSVAPTQDTAANSSRNPDSNTASDQGQSRFTDQSSENSRQNNRDANTGRSATRGEHGGSGLSSDDHTSRNSGSTTRRDGALFA